MKTIIWIEDNIDLLNYDVNRLNKLGNRIIPLESVKDATDPSSANLLKAADLILLDLFLATGTVEEPDLQGGVRVLEHIRNKNGLNLSTPIILVTVEDQLTGLQYLKKNHNVRDIITKPFAFERLRLAIEEALGASR